MYRKQLLLLTTLLFLTYGALAQSRDSVLVSRFRPGIMWFFGGLRTSGLTDAHKYDRLVFDINYNDWAGKGQQLFQQHWSSIGWNGQLFFDIPLTRKNTVALGIGLGYGHTRIRQYDMLERIDADKSTRLVPIPSDPGIDKSVFRSNKLFIPVELRFRTPGWKHFKWHIGGRIGYQFRASSSLHFVKDGHKTETRTVGFYDLNPLILSVHTRLGFRNWALTASYNVSPYFTSGTSTSLNGIEIGLSVSLF